MTIEASLRATTIFDLDAELPAQVFRRADWSFVVCDDGFSNSNSMLSAMGALFCADGMTGRCHFTGLALTQPRSSEACWLDVDGGTLAAPSGEIPTSLRQRWDFTIDVTFVMFPESLRWGIWVDHLFEVAVLGASRDLLASVRSHLDPMVFESAQEAVDDRLIPQSNMAPDWLEACRVFVANYGSDAP